MQRRTFLGSLAALPLIGFLPRMFSGIRSQYRINWYANDHEVLFTEYNDGRLVCAVDGKPTDAKAQKQWTVFHRADEKAFYEVRARLSKPNTLELDYVVISERRDEQYEFPIVDGIWHNNPFADQKFQQETLPLLKSSPSDRAGFLIDWV